MTPIIHVENLSKSYRITHGQRRGRYRTLRESITEAVLMPLRRLRNGRHQGRVEEFWALRDVNLDVRQGEVVGIIGSNGAGKSTLLKILSRITAPATGRVELRGRVGSLLEVGTGFHPELTGRDNIFLNGAILGMSRAEIRRKFDEIVAFAGTERFLDTPVKRYSSGMYVRLAFAVAAHLEPEILIIDEVLAVGDAEFQKKCLGKMKDISGQGRTVLFVSHNMAAVNQLCTSAVLLQEGRITLIAAPSAVIDHYTSHLANISSTWTRDPAARRPAISITAASVVDSDNCAAATFSSDEPIYVRIDYEVEETGILSRVVLELEHSSGTVVLTSTDCDEAGAVDRRRVRGKHSCRCVIPGRLLAPGTYYVTPCASWTNRVEYDRAPRAVRFEVSEVNGVAVFDRRPGVILPMLKWLPD
jgi:lipopolysaccharide transport system ATP-binding protein